MCRWRMGHVLAVLQLLLVCRALGEHSLFPRQESAGEGQCHHCQSYKIYIIVAVKRMVIGPGYLQKQPFTPPRNSYMYIHG